MGERENERTRARERESLPHTRQAGGQAESGTGLCGAVMKVLLPYIPLRMLPHATKFVGDKVKQCVFVTRPNFTKVRDADGYVAPGSICDVRYGSNTNKI